MTGMSFPKDFHDVTLFGQDFSPESGVVLIHAATDQTKVLTALKANPGYASSAYGTYSVYTWTDKNKTLYGSYHGDSLIVMGQCEKILRPNSTCSMARVRASRPILRCRRGLARASFCVAGAGLSNLKPTNRPISPLLAQVDNAWISIGEQDPNVVIHNSITALTPEAAQQISTSLQGIQAMADLAGSAEDARPPPRPPPNCSRTSALKPPTKPSPLNCPFRWTPSAPR